MLNNALIMAKFVVAKLISLGSLALYMEVEDINENWNNIKNMQVSILIIISFFANILL